MGKSAWLRPLGWGLLILFPLSLLGFIGWVVAGHGSPHPLAIVGLITSELWLVAGLIILNSTPSLGLGLWLGRWSSGCWSRSGICGRIRTAERC